MPITPVLEIAKEGYDIKTCTDDQKAFSSEFPTLKTKTVQEMTPNDEYYYHNLGYVPLYLYAGYLAVKTTSIGWIGQNTEDNMAMVLVDTQKISNDSNYEWATSALVYLFWDKLHD